jgi:hypothetical protein
MLHLQAHNSPARLLLSKLLSPFIGIITITITATGDKMPNKTSTRLLGIQSNP